LSALKRSRRLRRRQIVLAVIAVVLVVGVVFLVSRPRSEAPFEVISVSRGDITETVIVSGTLAPIMSVTVGAELSGIVADVMVDHNDRVRQGQVLARIDSTNAASQLRDAQGGLEVALGNERSAQARVAQAEARLQLRDADAQRARSLSDSGYLSRQGLERADSELALARAELGSATADLQSARGALARARASLGRANADYARATIVSPIDGIVMRRNVEPGQTLASTFQAPDLFVIASDPAALRLLAQVDEADVSKVQPGQRVEFQVSAHPGQDFHGSVTQVRNDPTVVDGLTTYTVVIEVQNPDRILIPGMTAAARVLTAERTGVVRAPVGALAFRPSSSDGGRGLRLVVRSVEEGERIRQAEASRAQLRASVARDGDVESVWRLDGDRPEEVPVQVGLRDDEYAEVLSGDIQVGDRLIVGNR
jgi:HlyD family secretion protein